MQVVGGRGLSVLGLAKTPAAFVHRLVAWHEVYRLRFCVRTGSAGRPAPENSLGAMLSIQEADSSGCQ